MNTTPEIRAELPTDISGLHDTRSNRLDSAHVHYYGRYFGDPRSRLFWQGNELWMGILPPYGPTFTEVFDSSVLRNLVAEGLVVDLEPVLGFESGFDAVYRLAHTPRITYWYEWSPRMWRAAALRLIELLQRLAEHNLTLRNAHPWNLLYSGRTFIYINPGSIVPLDPYTFSQSYEKLARFFVRPLVLVESGFTHMARRLTMDPQDGVLAEDVVQGLKEWAVLKPEYEAEQALPFLERLATGITSLVCRVSGNRWESYFPDSDDLVPGTSRNNKRLALENMLGDLGIKSVLDLGANIGHYSRMAVQHGREVIAIDFDPALVDTTFDKIDTTELPLYPVVMDFCHPTPGMGVGYQWFPPATERLQCDLVLCFALSHHMVFGKYRLDFEQVARGIRSFARDWALIEYVGREHVDPEAWRADAGAWYSSEAFVTTLSRYFRSVELSAPAQDGRRLIACGPHRTW